MATRSFGFSLEQLCCHGNKAVLWAAWRMGEKDNEVLVLCNLGGKGREKGCEANGRIIGVCEEVGSTNGGVWAIGKEQGRNWM